MTHEYECCILGSFCSVNGFKSCFCGSILVNCIGDGSSVCIGVADWCREDHLFELAFVFLHGFLEFIKFRTAHQRGRLYDQNLYLVFDSSLNSLFYVIDLFVISSLNVVDDDLCSEASSDGEVRDCFCDCLFDRADGCDTVVVVAGAEAAYQNFVAADLILIQRIILGSVAGILREIFIAALFFTFFQIVSKTGDFLLLCIGQGIPASSCCFAEYIRTCSSFLIVNRTGQVGHELRSEFNSQIVLFFKAVPSVNLFAGGLGEYLIQTDR